VSLAFAGVVVRNYQAYAREIADFQKVLAHVPEGKRVVGLVFDAESKVMDVDSIFRGVPSLYVALNPAPSSMVALRYCGMRHFPCSPVSAIDAVPAPDPWVPGRFDAKAGFAFFDYILARGRAPKEILPRKRIRKIAAQGAWTAFETR
jgi:hypothetical protein